MLAWLVEAQQLSGLDEHARRVVELPIEAAPLSVIARRVEAATREAMKGRPREAIEAAVHGAVRDAVFLFCLVFQINAQALEIAKVEVYPPAGVLLDERPAGWPAGRGPSGCGGARLRRRASGQVCLWRSVVESRVEVESRAKIETKFFGGHDVLLADAATEWASHVDLIERLAGMADAMHVPRAKADGADRSGSRRARRSRPAWRRGPRRWPTTPGCVPTSCSAIGRG